MLGAVCGMLWLALSVSLGLLSRLRADHELDLLIVKLAEDRNEGPAFVPFVALW